MATKRNDPCLDKAGDDEPIFVLRAQDRLAPGLVRTWADQAEQNGCPAAKVEDARGLADRMEAWPARKYPD